MHFFNNANHKNQAWFHQVVYPEIVRHNLKLIVVNNSKAMEKSNTIHESIFKFYQVVYLVIVKHVLKFWVMTTSSISTNSQACFKALKVDVPLHASDISILSKTWLFHFISDINSPWRWTNQVLHRIDISHSWRAMCATKEVTEIPSKK